MANDIAEKPAAAEEGVWITGPDGELIPDYDAAFPEINEGEVVHGTVGFATWLRVCSIGGLAPTSSSIGSTRIRFPCSSMMTVALRTSVMRTGGF